jgi:hypothetical protein
MSEQPQTFKHLHELLDFYRNGKNPRSQEERVEMVWRALERQNILDLFKATVESDYLEDDSQMRHTFVRPGCWLRNYPLPDPMQVEGRSEERQFEIWTVSKHSWPKVHYEVLSWQMKLRGLGREKLHILAQRGNRLAVIQVRVDSDYPSIVLLEALTHAAHLHKKSVKERFINELERQATPPEVLSAPTSIACLAPQFFYTDHTNRDKARGNHPTDVGAVARIAEYLKSEFEIGLLAANGDWELGQFDIDQARYPAH